MEAHLQTPPPRKISIPLVKHVNILPFFSLLLFFHVECFSSDVPGYVVELTASHSAVLFVPPVTVDDGAVSSVLKVTLLLTCTTACDVWDDICKKTR